MVFYKATHNRKSPEFGFILHWVILEVELSLAYSLIGIADTHG
jgi:hypothetical protein